MNYANYSDLKSKSKQTLKKIAVSGDIPEHIVLEIKKYNPSTGEEIPPRTREISLQELEDKKVDLTATKAGILLELAEINKMITDIKAL